MQLLNIFSYMSTAGCRWRECIKYASLSIPSQPSPAPLKLWLFACGLRELFGRMCSQKTKLRTGISHQGRTREVILSSWFSNCLLAPVAHKNVPDTTVVGLAPFQDLSN